MNGRCETDPLDRAVDVCDSCYGEFCRACLIAPKGRRHPICTDCALALSGVRGQSTVRPRGERRTAKTRRAELQTAGSGDEQVFRFFDAEAEAETSPEPKAKSSRRRPRRKSGAAAGPALTTTSSAAGPASPPASGDNGDGAPAEPPTGVTPAVARLEQLRRQQESVDADGPDDDFNVVDEAVSGHDIERTADQPTRADLQSDDRNLAGGPAGETVAEARARLRSDTVAHPDSPDEHESLDGAPPAPPERQRPVKPQPTARMVRPPERRQPPADGDGRPPTAPMIGEIRTLGSRRRDDQSDPPSVPVHPELDDDDELVRLSEALSGISAGGDDNQMTDDLAEADDDLIDDLAEADDDPTDADAGTDHGLAAPAPQRPQAGNPTPGRADTDANGMWIPPILRGLAPDAREASTNLPQRRRGS